MSNVTNHNIAGQVPSLLDWPDYRAAVESMAAVQAEYLALDRRYQAVICPPDGGAVDHGARADMAKRRRELRERIEAARRVVAERRFETSRELCQRLAPYHRDLARRMAAAILALGRLVEEELAFRARLDAEDVAYLETLPPLAAPKLGTPRRGEGPLIRWLYRQASAGVIDAETIPNAWKEGWRPST
jgi:hypothetical protein